MVLARKLGSEKEHIEEQELNYLQYIESEAVKIGDISLSDFANRKIEKQSPLHFFQFLAISQTLDRNSYAQLMLDNPNRYYDNHPEHVKMLFVNFSVTVGFLTFMASARRDDEISHTMTNASSAVIQVYEKASLLLEGIRTIVDKARTALLDPEDPLHKPIKEIVQLYLQSSNKEHKKTIFRLLGLNYFHSMLMAYRRSVQLAAEDESGFYGRLASGISEFAFDDETDFGLDYDILKAEDVDTLLAGNTEAKFQDENAAIAEIRSHGAKINELTSLTRKKIFEVDPGSVDLGNLAVPRAISISLDKQNPRRFSVKLMYANELGELTTLIWYVDSTKIIFDWNILDTPDIKNPEVMALQEALLSFSGVLLEKITQEERLKIRSKVSVPELQQAAAPKKNGIRNNDLVYTIRRKHARNLREVDKQKHESKQKKPVRCCINLDSDCQKISELKSKDRDDVLVAISDFNQRAIGQLVKVKAFKTRNVYRLRAGNKRILLEEIAQDNPNCERHFEVLDVRHRKDIYRRIKGD